MKSIRRFLLSFVYSNFIVAFAAAGMALVTYVSFGIDLNWYVIGFLFSITLFTYNFQRLVKFHHNISPDHSERNIWIIEKKTGLTIISLMGGIAALAFLPFLKLKSVLVLIPLGFISVFYAVKIFPFKGKRIALREIPFSKIFLIAITWVGATVWFPLLQSPVYGNFLEESSLISMQRFLFIFAITIPFDIRDIPYDTAEQSTFPQLFGIEKSLKIARILLLIFCLISFYQFLKGYIEEPVLYALLVSGFSTIYFVSKTKRDSPEIFYAGLLDSTMIIQALLIILFLVI